MNQQFDEGELVFLPAGITLLKFSEKRHGEDQPVVGSWTKTKNPCHVLIVENSKAILKMYGKYVKVFYEGSNWMARSEDLYSIGRYDVG